MLGTMQEPVHALVWANNLDLSVDRSFLDFLLSAQAPISVCAGSTPVATIRHLLRSEYLLSKSTSAVRIE